MKKLDSYFQLYEQKNFDKNNSNLNCSEELACFLLETYEIINNIENSKSSRCISKFNNLKIHNTRTINNRFFSSETCKTNLCITKLLETAEHFNLNNPMLAIYTDKLQHALRNIECSIKRSKVKNVKDLSNSINSLALKLQSHFNELISSITHKELHELIDSDIELLKLRKYAIMLTDMCNQTSDSSFKTSIYNLKAIHELSMYLKYRSYEIFFEIESTFIGIDISFKDVIQCIKLITEQLSIRQFHRNDKVKDIIDSMLANSERVFNFDNYLNYEKRWLINNYTYVDLDKLPSDTPKCIIQFIQKIKWCIRDEQLEGVTDENRY